VLSNGFTLEKRFDTEFEKIEKIGRGGFASVYKVRNILDNSHYAIKKIKIRIDNKNKDLQREISGVLQEIRYLAKFKSRYMVTYNHSWVEVNLTEKELNQRKVSEARKFRSNRYSNNDNENENDAELIMSELLEDVRGNINRDNSNSVNSNMSIEFVNTNNGDLHPVQEPIKNFNWGDDDDDDGIDKQIEAESTKSIKFVNHLKSIHYKVNTNKEEKKQKFSKDKDKDKDKEKDNKQMGKVFDNYMTIGNKEYSLNQIASISIFIQMELCNETLGDYLDRRNKKLTTNKRGITYTYTKTYTSA